MKFPGRCLRLLVLPVFACTILCALLIVLDGAVSGTTLPSVCFATIDDTYIYSTTDELAVQQAVDALGSPGGTVKIAGTCAGTQSRGGIMQTVFVSAPLTLRGGYTVTNWTVSDPDANPTVLDAKEGGRVIYAVAAITVENLTLQNGRSTNTGGGIDSWYPLQMKGTNVLSNSAIGVGGGVMSWGTADIVDSRIENNMSSRYGGGLRAFGALYLSNTQVVSNSALEEGGGLNSYSAAIIEGCTFERNESTSSSGGGIYAKHTLSIIDTHISSNTAYEDGGGVSVFSGYAVTITNSFIQNNESVNGSGGGIKTSNGSSVMMSMTYVLSNTAKKAGGGARMGKAATIVNSTFRNNVSTEGTGGGLLTLDKLAMTNTHMLSNTATHGGGAYIQEDATIASSHFANNKSLSGSGGGLCANSSLDMTGTHIISNTARGNGGGLRIGGDGTIATIVNSHIENNESLNNSGGGLWTQKTLQMIGTHVLSNTAYLSGGGLYAWSALEMTGTHVLSNTAYVDGGGVYAGGAATFVNSYIENNRSKGSYGGGLYASSTLAMTGTQVLSNTAQSVGGGVVADGAATFVNSYIVNNSAGSVGGGLKVGAPTAITGTQILSNTAVDDGGGVYASDAVSVGNSLFASNASTTGKGGGVFVADEPLSLTNSVMVSNTALHGGGIYAGGSGLNLINSTLAANHAITTGGAISTTGDLTITNSVVWDNTPTQAETTGSLSVTRSIIQDGELGGIDEDPRFVQDPDPLAGNLGDLRLRQDSPGIDAGDDTLAAGLTIDLDGLLRFFDVTAVANNGLNIIDMGAYELNSQLVYPVAETGGPYAGDEGAPIALDGRGSTAAYGILAYVWDCTNDGTVDAVSGSPTGNACTYPDNGSFTLSLLITDTGGLTDTASAAVTVSNLAPVVTAPADQAPAAGVVEGSQATLKLGSFADAGVNDNPWQVVVDWGDGSPDTTFPRDVQGNLPDKKHTYAKSGDYTVEVTVTDKDGDKDSDTFKVTVANVKPVVTAASDQTATEGASKSFALGSFSDPGADNPWQITVKWGDGKPDTTFSRDVQDSLPNKPHIYAAAGTFTVTVQVDDGDAIGSNKFRVTVSAVSVETGGVEGTVYEDKNNNDKPDSGEGVQGASVKLNQVAAAAFTNPVTTNADGDYAFSDVPVGDYSLTVTADGYKTPSATAVTVQKDTSETVAPIDLEPGVDDLSVYLPAVRSTSATQVTSKSKVNKNRVRPDSLERELFLPAITR